VVIALIVTPDGFPLAYEVLAGNTRDNTTLRSFLQKIEEQYGKAQRIWVVLCGAFSRATCAPSKRGAWELCSSRSRTSSSSVRMHRCRLGQRTPTGKVRVLSIPAIRDRMV
jgi:hypothetical protein